MTGKTNFNGSCFEKLVWSLDDDSSSFDSYQQQQFMARLKKVQANEMHPYDQKYERSVSVAWLGRVIGTLNNNTASTTLLSMPDSSMLGKMSLFRALGDGEKTSFVYPDRKTIISEIKKSLPKLLRFILDYKVPDAVPRVPRYGFGAYHNPSIMTLTLQNSPAGTLKEILIEVMSMWFAESGKPVFTGTALNLFSLIVNTHPAAGEIVKRMSSGAFQRYLELIKEEASLKITVSQDDKNTRSFTFYRDDYKKNTVYFAGTEPDAGTGSGASQAGH
jgi:hypothetical protein